MGAGGVWMSLLLWLKGGREVRVGSEVEDVLSLGVITYREWIISCRFLGVTRK